MVVLAILGARIQLALPTGFVTRLPARLDKGRAGGSAKWGSVVFGAQRLGFFAAGTQSHRARRYQKSKGRFDHFLTPSACGF